MRRATSNVCDVQASATVRLRSLAHGDEANRADAFFFSPVDVVLL
jgi:hypothetical protein